ncbi:MAG: PEP-CTERM sorting domain-containing protein [Acidobacteria bacterium]|nr:PEP-CTERM sorting domain-containing protein [Acidobacteriota bacterium]
MTITLFNPLEETSTLGAISLPDNEAYFVINNVNDVPEPGTALVVLAGVAAIYLRRR